MKQSKRKRKAAPTATSAVAEVAIAEEASSVANVSPPPAATAAEVGADYSLTPVCTIREGAELKSALLALEPSERPVTIDVRAIERIDTAALQLLCAFVRDRRSKGRRTQWTGSPTAFTEAVEILGLSQALGFPSGKAA